MNRYILIIVVFSLLSLSSQSGEREDLAFSPSDLVLSKDGDKLFVAGKTANEIRAYSMTDRGSYLKYDTKFPPKALELTDDYLLAACSHSHGELIILDRSTLKHVCSIPAGHGACDISLSQNKRTAYVCNQFSNDVSVIDLIKRKEMGRIPVLRQAIKSEISKDGKTLFVANFLPDGRGDVDIVSSKVSVIDLETELVIKHIELANGSNALRGMCTSPDGDYIFITHNLGRFQIPTTQLEQGWMNTSALSTIDVHAEELLGTILLDEPERGAPGSWGVTCDQEFIYVAHSGTHDVSRIEFKSFIKKIKNHPDKKSLEYDLQFLSGIRERIALAGNGPREIELDTAKLIIANYFSDEIRVIDLNYPEKHESISIKLTDSDSLDIIRLGEQYFNDAKYCFQNWQSCNGCHPSDARVDGLNWDLLNDGMGNSKSCKSMLLAFETPPAMISGIRPDAESAVRAGFQFIQFTSVSEDIIIAVSAYLSSLQAVPSPFLEEGKLSRSARKGKKVFMRLSCNTCHPASLYTDMQIHKIGEPGLYDHLDSWDTPTLIEVWRTGPYLHDGRCANLYDVFSLEKHGIEEELSKKDLHDLVVYVSSL